jgi:hypothetical protein
MRRKPISSRVSCWSLASERSTWRTSFRKSIVQPRAGFMSHSTRSGSVPVALFENHDFHLTGWNYPFRIVLSSCWTSRYEATLPAKPAAKAGLIFHFFQRGNSNSPRTTITGKSFEVLFNIRQKSWRVRRSIEAAPRAARAYRLVLLSFSDPHSPKIVAPTA